ncbi:MAG: hypothetical protein H7841_13785 [Magnetospirillum sp. WYHS-4]
MLWSLVLGIALVGALLLLAHGFVRADPKTLVRLVKWLAFGLVVVAILAMLATGRLAWAFAFLPVLAAWFVRLRNLYQVGKVFARAMSGTRSAGPKTSAIETRFLRMALDHSTGAMDGEVLEGEFAGRRLDSLALPELLHLLEDCSADPQSRQVLEAYLDRMRPDWRDAPEPGPAFADAMTPEEAWRILGLAPGASDADVKEAHRRLIGGLHPDHGGSGYLAAKVNQAKDLLLKGKK